MKRRKTNRKNFVNDKIFGSYLRSLRLKKGWSLEYARKQTDTSYLWRLENGESVNPTLDILVRISEAYDISLVDLVTDIATLCLNVPQKQGQEFKLTDQGYIVENYDKLTFKQQELFIDFFMFLLGKDKIKSRSEKRADKQIT